VRLLNVPAAGNTGKLRLEQVKMMSNYGRQAEKAAAYGIILGIESQ
jgi:hypothetical protein